eukprot:2501852-Pyramimonas_sp.AAC.1
MQAAKKARRAARDRNLGRMQHIANRNAQRGRTPTAVPDPSFRDRPPPPPREADETTLQRQGRARPSSDTLVGSDITLCR